MIGGRQARAQGDDAEVVHARRDLDPLHAFADGHRLETQLNRDGRVLDLDGASLAPHRLGALGRAGGEQIEGFVEMDLVADVEEPVEDRLASHEGHKPKTLAGAKAKSHAPWEHGSPACRVVQTLLPCCRLLQLTNLDLRHLHHRAHDAIRLCLVGIAHQLPQLRRNDLPGEPELVLEPAALALLPALRELLPVRVHLLLVLAFDHEGDGLAELEVRPAVQRHEGLTLELEPDDHDPALGPGSGVAVVRRLDDFGIGEDRTVELSGLLGLMVIPDERCDSLHECSPFVDGRRDRNLGEAINSSAPKRLRASSTLRAIRARAPSLPHTRWRPSACRRIPRGAR